MSSSLHAWATSPFVLKMNDSRVSIFLREWEELERLAGNTHRTGQVFCARVKEAHDVETSANHPYLTMSVAWNRVYEAMVLLEEARREHQDKMMRLKREM